MSLSKFNWQSPPWQGGTRKYRLGLRPIALDKWFATPISDALYHHKKALMDEQYNNVVQVVDGSAAAQAALAENFDPETLKRFNYPDVIAGLSLTVSDDLCLIEARGEQRLLAASVCSPSYWNLRDKIGRPLSAIHAPVRTLEEKIGEKIARFISNVPTRTPFERINWFVHSDRQRFHPETSAQTLGDPATWIVRSERETLCRFTDDLALFTIDVRFADLAVIHAFPQARQDLASSLSGFDDDEINYFGGREKVRKLSAYLAAEPTPDPVF